MDKKSTRISLLSSKVDPTLLDLIDRFNLLSIENYQNPSDDDDTSESILNKKIQLILSLIKLPELEHLCPFAIRRKLFTLSHCQFGINTHYEDRLKIMRIAISIGRRVAFELLVKNSDSKKIKSHLWAAIRNRGCQFLGPAIQEEVLKLIILVLGDGTQLTREVLILYVLQQIEKMFPKQVTKTSIGHVVQILYRASCFELIKRQGESCLMQLKKQYREYDDLRREHDSQIVCIALEAGIRLSPEQWSSLLYGDSLHKSHMQSIIDKLNATNAPFDRLVNQLQKTLVNGEDPIRILDTISYFGQLIHFEKNIKNGN